MAFWLLGLYVTKPGLLKLGRDPKWGHKM